MPINQNTTKIRGFGGIVNTRSPEELNDADRTKFPLLEAENVYLTNARRLKRRPGFVLQTAGNYHSLWSGDTVTLVVSGADLIHLDQSLNETVLRSGLTPNSPMSYDEWAGSVYYMNEAGEYGKVVGTTHLPWGLPPLDPPVVTGTGGSLPPGSYQVAVTQRLASGEESGVLYLTVTTLGDGEGLVVTIPPLAVDAAYASVYASLPDGEVLFEVDRVAAGTSSVTISNTSGYGQQLRTLDVIPPPEGTQVAYSASRMCVVSGSLLYYSDSFAPSHFREEQFYSFAADITLVAPVDGGIYVSADKTYFIKGDDPASSTLEEVSDSVAVKGSLEYLQPGEYPDLQETAAVWLSNRGFIIGVGGSVRHMTEEEFTFAVADSGTIGKVKQDGVTTLIGLMPEPSDEDNNFGLTDRVSVEIIRNTVV